MRREFAMATVRGLGYWWFDMFGGWFDSPALMKEIAAMREITTRLRDEQVQTVARVAVFGDTESMYYLDTDGPEGTALIARQREGLGRMGTPYDIYTLSDIESPAIPHDRYRLYVFLNAFRLSDERLRFIRQLADEGKSVLWIYAPGYVSSDGLSAGGISETTGLDIRELAGAERSARIAPNSTLNPTATEIEYGFDDPAKPVFTFEADGLEVAAQYTRSGLSAACIRKNESGYAFYSGAPNLPGTPLREIARLSGAYIYCENGSPFYCSDRLMGIHMPESGSIELRVPRDLEVEELFDGGTYRSSGGILSIKTDPGAMKLFHALGNGTFDDDERPE
jgi:hypothetical protein